MYPLADPADDSDCTTTVGGRQETVKSVGRALGFLETYHKFLSYFFFLRTE